jgi:hypothetical protein
MAGARKSPAAKSLLVAKDGFVCNVKGVEYVVKQAERLASDHPVVKAYPDLFEPAQEAAA